MLKPPKSLGHHKNLQNEMESDFMSAPNASLSTPYSADLQTQEYRPSRVSDEVVLNASAVADLEFSWLDEAVQQIQEVHEEVKEALELDSEIAAVPDSAYHDAFWLLDLLDYCNVPMPDIGWLPDGGIGFEWRSRSIKGIATMSIYGDNKVIYGASLGGTRREKGTCAFSDISLLISFLPTLIHLCSQ